LGDDTTGEDELRDYGLDYIPDFVGVFPSDRVPTQRGEVEAMVINVDPTGSAGSHWCGLYRDGDRTVIWDSFGRPVHDLFPDIDAEDCESDAEQKVKENWCGAGSLAWLLVASQLGIDAAKHV
jgi:hypothetical protein